MRWAARNIVRSDCGWQSKRKFISIFICTPPVASVSLSHPFYLSIVYLARLRINEILFLHPLSPSFSLPISHLCVSWAAHIVIPCIDKYLLNNLLSSPIFLPSPLHVDWRRTICVYIIRCQSCLCACVCLRESIFKTFNNKNFDTSAHVSDYGREKNSKPTEIPLVRLYATQYAIEYTSSLQPL